MYGLGMNHDLANDIYNPNYPEGAVLYVLYKVEIL